MFKSTKSVLYARRFRFIPKHEIVHLLLALDHLSDSGYLPDLSEMKSCLLNELFIDNGDSKVAKLSSSDIIF